MLACRHGELERPDAENAALGINTQFENVRVSRSSELHTRFESNTLTYLAELSFECAPENVELSGRPDRARMDGERSPASRWPRRSRRLVETSKPLRTCHADALGVFYMTM
jgi:hypothetical protein